MATSRGQVIEPLISAAMLAALIYFSRTVFIEFDPVWTPITYASAWLLAVIMFRKVKPVRWALVTPVKLVYRNI